MQAKLAIRTIALHGETGEGGAGIEAYLSALQTPEDRVDIIRADWEARMADTERLLDAFARTQSASG